MSLIPWMLMAAGSAAVDYVNPLPQPGDADYTTRPRHHFRMVMENDSAAGSDCNYSHGTRFDYARSFAKNSEHAWGLSLTQNIYTGSGWSCWAGFCALSADPPLLQRP